MHAHSLSQAQPLHFITTRDAHGCECFFILRASRTAMLRLKAEMGKGGTDMSQFGEVVYSGYGTHPLAHEQREIHERFGIVVAGNA